MKLILFFPLVLFACTQAVPLSKRSTLNEGLQCLLRVGFNACAQGKTDAAAAATSAKEMYPADSFQHGIGDAFRHCYWNALMSIHLNQDVAQQIADLYEEMNTIGTENQRQMDLKNNPIGREVGSQAKNVDEAREKCQEYVQTGYLQLKA